MYCKSPIPPMIKVWESETPPIPCRENSHKSCISFIEAPLRKFISSPKKPKPGRVDHRAAYLSFWHRLPPRWECLVIVVAIVIVIIVIVAYQLFLSWNRRSTHVLETHTYFPLCIFVWVVLLDLQICDWPGDWVDDMCKWVDTMSTSRTNRDHPNHIIVIYITTVSVKI